MKDKLGGRRYWLCCAIIVAACGLLWLGKLTGSEWVECVTWVCGAYVLGNVAQRGVEAAQAVKSKM